MGILFKTYNRKHQLHLYQEKWVFPDKKYLDELLGFLSKEEAIKIVVVPTNTMIEVELNGIIVNCRGLDDVKKKFGLLAEMKERFQKVLPPVKKSMVRK